MKNTFTLLLLCILIAPTYSQIFEGCVTIDFETLPDQTPEDNLIMSDQFFGEYGVTFILSDGTAPRLARVGNPTTAFGSSFGNDAPAPGQGIGSYFITDDGMLSGLTSPDLIVNFVVPMDSFSAVVLDIDFGEVFTIESRDIFGEVIHTITITDGDPNTGDGMATPFGFNSNECEPPIHSIKFHGTRTLPGAFGLGMDNFSFCTTDPDIRTLVHIETIPPTCVTPSGTITLDNQSGDTYTFSLDHGPFQSSPIFNNVTPGLHSITFRTPIGCEVTVPVVIEGFIPLVISDISVTNTSCGEDNGALVVFATPNINIQYSIDGSNYQSSNTFTDIPAGSYTLSILDQDNCFDNENFVIENSFPLEIESVLVIDDYCNDSKGSLTISTTGGTGVLQFSINDQESSPISFISDLTPGTYNIKVLDEVGCEAIATNEIAPGVPFWIEELSFSGPTCEEVNGLLTFHASGGTGFINYTLNETISHPTGDFIGLHAGLYQLSAIDENGCQLDSIAALPLPQCPIYIPNGFSPNHDGINDEFHIFTNTFYDVQVERFMIFDRWGELVWLEKDFTINTSPKWWDGTFRNQPAQQGVYVYVIEVKHQTGFEEVFAGDITLVR